MEKQSKLSLYYDQFCEIAAPKVDLVLVHGWGMNSLVWDRIMPILLKHFRVTVIDLPGMGRSPIPAGDYDLDYLATHLLSVAPKKAVWVGWSLGALAVVRAAARAPERIQGVVMMASNPKFVSDCAEEAGIEASSLSLFKQLLEEDWQGSLIRFLALQCKGSKRQKEDIRFLKERLFHHGLPARQVLRDGLKLLADEDMREEVSALKQPLLVLLGESDEVVPSRVVELYRKLQPAADVHLVASAAHIPFLSDPDFCARAVVEYIERNEIYPKG